MIGDKMREEDWGLDPEIEQDWGLNIDDNIGPKGE